VSLEYRKKDRLRCTAEEYWNLRFNKAALKKQPGGSKSGPGL